MKHPFKNITFKNKGNWIDYTVDPAKIAIHISGTVSNPSVELYAWDRETGKRVDVTYWNVIVAGNRPSYDETLFFQKGHFDGKEAVEVFRRVLAHEEATIEEAASYIAKLIWEDLVRLSVQSISIEQIVWEDKDRE